MKSTTSMESNTGLNSIMATDFEDDDDREEFYVKEYSDDGNPVNYGFRIGKRDGEVYIEIVPLKYYHKTGYISDWHIAWSYPDFDQYMESCFCYDGDKNESELQDLLGGLGMTNIGKTFIKKNTKTKAKTGKISTDDCKKEIAEFITSIARTLGGDLGVEFNPLLIRAESWKRTSKMKLANHHMNLDFCGRQPDELLSSYYEKIKVFKPVQIQDNFTIRTFFAPKDYSDSIQIEIVTNETDTEIVFIGIGVD